MHMFATCEHDSTQRPTGCRPQPFGRSSCQALDSRHLDTDTEVVSRSPYSPAGHVGGVGALAGTVGVSDLEDGADRAAVLARRAVHADVVEPAVLGVGVQRVRADAVTLSRALEAVGQLCRTEVRLRYRPRSSNVTHILSYKYVCNSSRQIGAPA